MSILIKGMTMPTRCADCKMYVEDIYCCHLLHREIENPWADDGVELDCPLVPVPPHGRLIDADALIKVFKTKAKNPLNQETAPYSWAFAYECLADVVGDMPTIIPAEEGE